MKSVLRISCGSCTNEFHGYLEGSPISGTGYVAVCPKCSEEYYFSDTAMWIEMTAPEGAVEFKIVN